MTTAKAATAEMLAAPAASKKEQKTRVTLGAKVEAAHTVAEAALEACGEAQRLSRRTVAGRNSGDSGGGEVGSDSCILRVPHGVIQSEMCWHARRFGCLVYAEAAAAGGSGGGGGPG
jgi:hypothetical protein